ncbi:hypothetical protein [Planctomicrobium sp. SH664]|uniref:pyroglutamyl-peptidase I family protein n=1 Tax=Planctomicrobium sp. SH664 TaxID=3448125 RepID=UPI003F5C7FC0
MRFLITGFPPFPGCESNPSQQLLELVEHGRLNLPEAHLECRLLSVEYARIEPEFSLALEETKPDVVLSFGVGRQEADYQLERRGINRNHRELPDNAGEIRINYPIEPEGPEEIFASIDLYRLQKFLSASGYFAEVSLNAGEYLCNHLLYTGLRLASSGQARFHFLFTHLAQSSRGITPEQNLAALETIIRWFLNGHCPTGSGLETNLANASLQHPKGL